MIIGDEWIVIAAVAGRLPDELKDQPLMTVPAAITRIRRSTQRAQEGAALGRGRLTRVLGTLSPGDLALLLGPARRLFGVVNLTAVRAEIAAAHSEAEQRGIRLNEFSAQYVGAASHYGAPIWVGYDRNIPRWAQEGVVLRSVRWRRLSEL